MAHHRATNRCCIDGAQLERMARIARGLPGRLVSLRQQRHSRARRERAELALADSEWPPAPLVCVDGVLAAELVARCERG